MCVCGQTGAKHKSSFGRKNFCKKLLFDRLEIAPAAKICRIKTVSACYFIRPFLRCFV